MRWEEGGGAHHRRVARQAGEAVREEAVREEAVREAGREAVREEAVRRSAAPARCRRGHLSPSLPISPHPPPSLPVSPHLSPSLPISAHLSGSLQAWAGRRWPAFERVARTCDVLVDGRATATLLGLVAPRGGEEMAAVSGYGCERPVLVRAGRCEVAAVAVLSSGAGRCRVTWADGVESEEAEARVGGTAAASSPPPLALREAATHDAATHDAAAGGALSSEPGPSPEPDSPEPDSPEPGRWRLLLSRLSGSFP